MNPMKRVGLAVLLLIVGAILDASPALAGKPAKSSVTSSPLTPPVANAPEPVASGTVTYVHSWFYDQRTWVENVDVTVSCEGLTPTNQYCVVFSVLYTYYTADGGSSDLYWYERLPTATNKKGALTTQWSYLPWDWYYLPGYWSYYVSTSILDVWVENEQGAVVLERAP